MGRIFEIKYTVTIVKKLNNVYAKAFYINSFKIGGVERECELRVSYGYVNFKNEIKNIKRKYNYNKKYDSFYCYEIVEGEVKLLKPVSSTEDKITDIEKKKRLDIYLKRFFPKEEEQDMEETNFAQPSALEVLQRMAKAARGDSMKIQNVYSNEKKGVTTVKFADGCTVQVQCDKEDKFDVYKGVAMALAKAAFGSKELQKALSNVVIQKEKAPKKKEPTKKNAKAKKEEE